MPVVPAAALGFSPLLWAVPTLMVGLITPALNRRYQRMGDLVCGTMVIVERRGGLAGIAKFEDPRAARLAAVLPATLVVDPKLSLALSTYVDRRGSFSPQRRREIACHLAGPLLQQLQLPADTSHDLLLCALYHRAYIAEHVAVQEASP